MKTNIQSDWKRIFRFFSVCLLMTPNIIQAGSFTIGFNLILQSRFGLTAGYFFTDNFGIEGHFGGLGRNRMAKWGFSLILVPTSYENNFYFLLGYAAGQRWDLFTKKHLDSYRLAHSPLRSAEVYDKGFNIALGYEVNLGEKKWRVPMEAGIYLITHSELIQYWDRTSYSTSEHVYVGRERKRKKPYLTPLLGYGLRWYSNTDN